MRNGATTTFLACLLTLTACAQVDAQPPPPEAKGSLVVSGTQKTGGVNGIWYTEGAVPDIILRDATGRSVGRKSGGGLLRFDNLAPGQYTIEPALRPCDANCDYLDPRTDACSGPVQIGADVVRLHVIYTMGEACRIEPPS
jgi:hypothetical protein